MKVLESTSIWCDAGTSDKVYSIQLIDMENGSFRLDTQYGARPKVISGAWQGRSFKDANGKDAKTDADANLGKFEARRLYNDLLRSKVKKGYTKSVPTIMPVEYRNGATVAVMSKEDLAVIARDVSALHDFLSAASATADGRSGLEILDELI